MSEQQPPVAAATPPVEQPSRKGISIWAAIAISVVTSSIGSGVTYWQVAQNGVTPNVVVVDSVRIANARLRAMTADPSQNANPAAVANEFVDKLETAIRPLVDAGYVVVNKSTVLGVSKELDITNAVAQQVGVKLD